MKVGEGGNAKHFWTLSKCDITSNTAFRIVTADRSDIQSD